MFLLSKWGENKTKAKRTEIYTKEKTVIKTYFKRKR
jgi:hypothetical protein